MDPYAPQYPIGPPELWAAPQASPALVTPERDPRIKAQRRLIGLLTLALLVALSGIALPYLNGQWSRGRVFHPEKRLRDPTLLEQVVRNSFLHSDLVSDVICVETSRSREFVCSVQFIEDVDRTLRVFVSADGKYWVSVPFSGG